MCLCVWWCRQEVQRVRSAVEAEWAAKADEAKRKAEVQMHHTRHPFSHVA